MLVGTLVTSEHLPVVYPLAYAVKHAAYKMR